MPPASEPGSRAAGAGAGDGGHRGGGAEGGGGAADRGDADHPGGGGPRLARSPEGMALGATGLGAAAALAGLQLSLWQDTPAGPSIIVAATGWGHILPSITGT
jgi:hypothetical protein